MMGKTFNPTQGILPQVPVSPGGIPMPRAVSPGGMPFDSRAVVSAVLNNMAKGNASTSDPTGQVGPTPSQTLPTPAVTQSAPRPSVAPATGQSLPPGSDMSDYMRHGLSDLQRPEMATTKPDGPDLLSTILGLVQGGAYAASAYNQGLAGNRGPTGFEQNIARQQELKIQQNQFQQQLAMNKAQFENDKALRDLDNEYAIKLRNAVGQVERDNLKYEYDQRVMYLQSVLDKKMQAFQKMFQGGGISSLANIGQSPTPQDKVGMMQAAGSLLGGVQ